MKLRICFVLILAMTVLFLVSCDQTSVLLPAVSGAEESPDSGDEGPAGGESQEAGSGAGMIVVHICGFVMNPGVYEVEAGSRIYQVLELAGGFAPGAAESYLNLAEQVKDGQKLVVPSLDEVENDRFGQETMVAGNSLVNINTADKELLMTLPGIGEAKALAIIAWRTKNGAFQSTEDIMQVSGIKEAAYEKIKALITAE